MPFREAFKGELALIQSSKIDPLVRWLEAWLETHDEVSANDVPRDVPGQFGLENHSIGPALRRLQWQGRVYPVKRIPAAEHNAGSHREVTLYRRKAAPVQTDLTVPAGVKLIRAAQVLVMSLRGGGWTAPKPAEVEATGVPPEAVRHYLAGMAARQAALAESVQLDIMAEALAELGIDMTDERGGIV
ncbi:hypothetical protein FJY71_03510 [candidate division WOR-3 bacterium]|nr:hypothetical protein [candidate division WOR-3 bacterium]